MADQQLANGGKPIKRIPPQPKPCMLNSQPLMRLSAM